MKLRRWLGSEWVAGAYLIAVGVLLMVTRWGKGGWMGGGAAVLLGRGLLLEWRKAARG